MKLFLVGTLAVLLLFGNACRKDSFITSADALLQTSTDTLHFDTVFTTTGSVTQLFKIFNANDRKLKLSSIRLYGGTNSFFKMNVDGTPGADFSNIELDANDSLYVFVTVTINPNATSLPFVVQDSIGISYNGNNRFIQLEAFGQNAHFFRNRRVQTSETLINDLPYVLLGPLTINNGITLSIDPGVKVFCHSDAAILVNGTLKVNGTIAEPVVFTGDRLDEGYRNLPGSWPGIYFNGPSLDNVLEYAVVKNAYQGVVAQLPAPNGRTKVVLNECTIDNVYDAGILALNSTLSARNCLVTNCGNNIGIGSGGNCSFTHCTVASYGNFYISHRNPVLYITNSNSQLQTNALIASFTNCVFYGEGGIVEDEIQIAKEETTAAFSLTFQNVLYKAKKDPSNMAGVSFANSQLNKSPAFDSIDVGKKYYNFRPAPGSPLIDAAVNTGTTLFDLDGKPRGIKPDIGCYEN